jgi:hypothetical protein
MVRSRNPEIQRKHVRSRKQVIERLAEGKKLHVTVIHMSITHAVASLRFHEDPCPFLGFGVICGGVTSFSGDLLRSGPHRFRVVENSNAKDGLKEEWHIRSDDGSFEIITEEIWEASDAGASDLPSEPNQENPV